MNAVDMTCVLATLLFDKGDVLNLIDSSSFVCIQIRITSVSAASRLAAGVRLSESCEKCV